MRTLTANEIEEVNGGMALDTGIGLIGGIGTLAAIFDMPYAALIAGGIVLGAYAERAYIEATMPQ